MSRFLIRGILLSLLLSSVGAFAQGQPPVIKVTGTLSLGTQDETFNASLWQGREAMIQRLDPVTGEGFRLVMNVVSGTNQGADHKLFLRIYRPQNGAWLLVGEPVLFTMDGQEASMTLGDPPGGQDHDFKLEILVEKTASDLLQGAYSDGQICSSNQLEYSAAFMSGCCSSQCTVGPGTMTCCGAIVCCTCGTCCQTP